MSSNVPRPFGSCRRLPRHFIALCRSGRARQVIDRLSRQRGSHNAKAGVRRIRRCVLQCVPPDVGSVEERAAHLGPVRPGVFDRRHALAGHLAANRPTGLGDPDRLIAYNRPGLIQGRLEEIFALSDGVGFGILKIRVGVETDEVNRVNDRLVGSVHVGCPGIDMSDRNILEARVLDCLTDPADVAD